MVAVYCQVLDISDESCRLIVGVAAIFDCGVRSGTFLYNHGNAIGVCVCNRIANRGEVRLVRVGLAEVHNTICTAVHVQCR